MERSPAPQTMDHRAISAARSSFDSPRLDALPPPPPPPPDGPPPPEIDLRVDPVGPPPSEVTKRLTRVANRAEAKRSVQEKAESDEPEQGHITLDELAETIRVLGGLRDEGFLTDDEFATKKSELLARL